MTGILAVFKPAKIPSCACNGSPYLYIKMKKVVSLIVIALVYTAFFGCTKNIQNDPASNRTSSILARTSTNDPTLAPGLYEEFPVDLNPCVLDLTTLSTWSGNFVSHFQFTNAFATAPMQCVSASSLLSVFNSMNNDGSHMPGAYFRGLRIIYGATAEGAIKLVFVPVYADSTGMDSVKTQFTVSPGGTDITSLSGNKIYIAQDGALVDISNDVNQLTTAKDWIANYRANIQIKATDDGTFRNQTSDGGTDANAGFFPFQEIIALIEDNACTTVKFISIGKITMPGNIYRHDLAMKPSNFSGTGNAQFTNLAADMGTLCPPVCNAVTYSKASF